VEIKRWGQHTTMRRRQGRRRRASAAVLVDPFAGRDRFPPLEEAFSIASAEEDHQSDSSLLSLNLSIGARAALHEHLRHVARFGIDDSFVGTKSPNDHDLNAAGTGGEVCPPRDPLDEEWERLLSSSSDEGGRSSYSPGSSFSLRNSRIEHDSGCEGDEDRCEDVFEVLTEMSTDYFNSSRVKLLLTPEKNRHRRGEVTTRRGGSGVESSSNSSIISSSVEEDKIAYDLCSVDRGDDGDEDSRDAGVDGSNQLFSNAEALEAIEVSRISGLDDSHISADGSDVGQRSFHLFPPSSMTFSALTLPRPTISRSADDHRSTIDDGLARVAHYSSPQRSSTWMRSPSQSLSNAHNRGSRSCLPPSWKSLSGNSVDTRTISSRDANSKQEGAGLSKADAGMIGLPHLGLSPISAQSGGHQGECLRHDLPSNLSPLHHLDNYRRFSVPPMRQSDDSSVNAPSCSGFRIDPRPTATFTVPHHDHVEVVYDRTHDSDISSLQNHSSSVDRTSTSSTTSAAVAAGVAGKSLPERNGCDLKYTPTQEIAPNLASLDRQLAVNDRRRYRTVVPSRVFMKTRSALDDDLLPEPYDSFSNPLPATRERCMRISSKQNAASHRSAPL
jgi:hypothetical protein